MKKVFFIKISALFLLKTKYKSYTDWCVLKMQLIFIDQVRITKVILIVI